MSQKTRADLLVSGGPLLAMDAAGSFFRDGAVAVANGRILAVGERDKITATFDASKTIDASKKAILPGFVNCHGHSGLTLLRGLAEEFPLQHWLTNTIWPVMKFAQPEDTYAGARLACLEMIRSGITTFTDMWRDLAETAKAVEESGLRARLAFNMRDFSDPALLDFEWNSGFEAVSARRPTSLVRYGLAPHSLYACSNEMLRRCSESVESFGCHVQIHIAETEREVIECREKTGRTPVERLDELGLLGPQTLMAHGVWLNETDCTRSAKAGATVSHNITSNLKLASGVAPLTRFQSARLNVALGTDSAASNNVLDPFREMKYAALLQRAEHRDPVLLPPLGVLEAATRNGARALGMADEIGSLEPGKRADLILLDLDKPHFAPARFEDAETLASLIVFSAGAADVDTSIAEGRVLMQNRKVLSLDPQMVCDAAQTASRQLLRRAGF